MAGSRELVRGRLGLGLLGLAALGAGYLGQGSWGIGVRQDLSSVSAIVTDVTGGAGARQPARLQISVAVSNQGTDPVRVRVTERLGDGVSLDRAEPETLTVEAGATARLEAGISVRCMSDRPLRLPPLALVLPDGSEVPVTVGGSARLLEGCSRAASAARPLVVEALPSSGEKDQESGDGGQPSPGTRLRLELRSPTGPAHRITAIRAGGVPLRVSPSPLTVPPSATVRAELEPPASCPPHWQVNGLPTAVSVDLAAAVPTGRTEPTGPAGHTSPASPGAGQDTPVAVEAGTTVQVRLGPPLTEWLLATACAEPEPATTGPGAIVPGAAGPGPAMTPESGGQPGEGGNG